MAVNVQIARPGQPTDLDVVLGVKLIRVVCAEGVGDVPTWAFEWYRAIEDDFAAAEAVGITFDPAFDDVDVVVGKQYFYWGVALSDLAAVTRSAPAGSVSAVAQSEESLQVQKGWYDQSLFLNLGYMSQGWGEYKTPTDGLDEFLVNDVVMNGQPVKFVLNSVVGWIPAVFGNSNDHFDVEARFRILDTDDLSEPLKAYTPVAPDFEIAPQDVSTGSMAPNNWNVIFFPQLWIDLEDGETSPYVSLKVFSGIVDIPDDATLSGLEVAVDVSITGTHSGLTLEGVLIADDGTLSDPVSLALPDDTDGIVTLGGSTEDWGLDPGDLVGSQWNTNDVELRLTLASAVGATVTLIVDLDNATLKPHFTPLLPKVVYQQDVPLYGINAAGSNGSGGYVYTVEWGTKLFNIYYDFEADELPPLGHTAQFRIDFTSTNWPNPDTQSGSIDLSSGTLKIRQRG